MLRRGIERAAGPRADIMIPPALNPVDRTRAAQLAGGESRPDSYDAPWLEAGESDRTAVLAAPIAGRDMPCALSPRRVEAPAKAFIAKSAGETWARRIRLPNLPTH
jgi:hypothetical protein